MNLTLEGTVNPLFLKAQVADISRKNQGPYFTIVVYVPHK